jgi:hypothetical protein
MYKRFTNVTQTNIYMQRVTIAEVNGQSLAPGLAVDFTCPYRKYVTSGEKPLTSFDYVTSS